MPETKDLLVMIFFIAAGLFSIISSILNWNFFFENSRASFFVKIFGRNGARIFYTLLGFTLIYLAFIL